MNIVFMSMDAERQEVPLSHFEAAWSAAAGRTGRLSL